MSKSREVRRHLMRSRLFVPGNREDFFQKAMRSEADVVCFDLEDSVLPEYKSRARSLVRDFLQASPSASKTIMVRVNATRSQYFAEDISAVVLPTLSIINLPKVEDPSELIELSAALSRLEYDRGIADPIAILATIESPRGLRLAHAIAQADSRVAGLQLGLVDLFESLKISAKNTSAAYQVRLLLRLAAGEAGVPCFDSAFSDIADAEMFLTEAKSARGLGFSGKSCIHPSQIAAINQIFSPTEDELEKARSIVKAAQEAALKGLGAFRLDGRMVDEPMVRSAKELLRLNEKYRAD